MKLVESGILLEVRHEGQDCVGTVETDQGMISVDLTHLPDARPGDVILFHSGIAFRVALVSTATTGSSRSGSTSS